MKTNETYISYDFIDYICNAYQDQLEEDKIVYFFNASWMYHDEFCGLKRLRYATPAERKLFLFRRNLFLNLINDT